MDFTRKTTFLFRGSSKFILLATWPASHWLTWLCNKVKVIKFWGSLLVAACEELVAQKDIHFSPNYSNQSKWSYHLSLKIALFPSWDHCGNGDADTPWRDTWVSWLCSLWSCPALGATSASDAAAGPFPKDMSISFLPSFLPSPQQGLGWGWTSASSSLSCWWCCWGCFLLFPVEKGRKNQGVYLDDDKTASFW